MFRKQTGGNVMISPLVQPVYEAIAYLSHYCLEFLFGFNGEKGIRLLSRLLYCKSKSFFDEGLETITQTSSAWCRADRRGVNACNPRHDAYWLYEI